MGEIRTFEDLRAWQIARELSKTIYDFTRSEKLARDFGLVDQLRRASVSVMSNVAEGFERGSNKDFVRFLFIARASAGEVRSLLFVALDQGYLSQDEVGRAQDSCREASYTIWGLIKSLRKRMNWVTGGTAAALGTVAVFIMRATFAL